MEFKEAKAAALAWFFVQKSGGRLSYLKVLKLMYLTERRMIANLEPSITDDIFVSMKHGPVLSSTYDLIKGNWEDRDHDVWESVLETDKEKFELLIRSEMDPANYLSRHQLKVAEQVFQDFAEVHEWDLVEQLHRTIPEWEETTSSKPITKRAILKAVEKDPDLVEGYLEAERANDFWQSKLKSVQ